jgi:hypothetical protein
MNGIRKVLGFVCVWSLLILALLSSGCKKEQAPEAAAGSVSSTGVPSQFRDLRSLPGTVFNVTYSPNVVRIDLATTQKALKSVSDDGQVFVFESDDPRFRNLREGKIMFLEHLGARRVLAVHTEGQQIAFLTESAALTDLIQEGTIEFSVPVNFRELQARTSPGSRREDERAGRGNLFAVPSVYASEPKLSVHTKGEINDWEFEIEGEPEGDGLSLSLDAAKKKLAGLTASVKIKGEVEHIVTAFKARIHGNKMQEFEYSTPLKGHVNVSWAVLTTGPNSGIGEARLKLPPFAKDIFDVYGIPFLFKIDEALIFKPGFGGKKDAAEGKFHVNYDGDAGVSIHGEQSTPKGTMNAEPEAEKTLAESLAAHGVVIAVNAPKVSVSLGTESMTEAIKEAIPKGLGDKVAEVLEKGPFGLGGLVKKAKEDFFHIEGGAYLQLVTEFDYAGSGPLSLVPCSMTHLNFFAQAGADATLFALQGESPKLNLKETHWTKRDPDVPICGQK